uniref:helix-turn-helix domain-containing protein n=1 Tax=Parerythrobacter lutipelagi TaxID=1964208 RepID=UPI0010F46B25|nr:helix-turn-helix transcriptional regulator [Parerythrobacter lutipelagi]
MTQRTYARNRIQELRKAAGLSLEALGAAIPSELTASTISKLEKGRMALSADYIIEIASALGVEPGEIFLGGGQSGRIVSFIDIKEAREWRRADTKGSVAVPDHIKGDLFALRCEHGLCPSIAGDGGSIIVAPQERELEDGKTYLADVGERGDEYPACYRFDQHEMILESLTIGRVDAKIGAEPLAVLGRAVFVGCDL